MESCRSSEDLEIYQKMKKIETLKDLLILLYRVMKREIDYFMEKCILNMKDVSDELAVKVGNVGNYFRRIIGKFKIILYGKEEKYFSQGDIIKVNLGYNIGSEINKERYAVIISPDFINKSSTNCIVLPITSFKDVKKIGRDIHCIVDNYLCIHKGVILINNIRDVSKKELLKKYDHGGKMIKEMLFDYCNNSLLNKKLGYFT